MCLFMVIATIIGEGTNDCFGLRLTNIDKSELMKKLKYAILNVGVFLYTTLFLSEAYGQYGLGFAGQEVVQDQRTGLDLTSDKSFCFNKDFEISFELAFLPNRTDYFGYIMRIIENDENNIDLIYDRRPIVDKHFRVIHGDQFLNAAFDINRDSLFEGWTEVAFKFDASKNALIFRQGGVEITEHIELKKDGCVKVLFGFNNHKDFKITDVPAMKIRNIRIKEGGKLKNHWPLDEYEGAIAKDVVGRKNAAAINPMWIKLKHHNWQLLQTIKTSGRTNVAFDATKECVYLIGTDSLLSYTIPTNEITVYPYRSGTLNLVKGSQAVYDTVSGRLMNFCVDQQLISTFDFETLSWNVDFVYQGSKTHHYHLNKFYSSMDSSLYFIGGYGHFTYKNDVMSYSFSSNEWKNHIPGGHFFSPRYLAALGTAKGGAFLIGGYGSASGQQMLNPKNLYDLVYFDVHKKTFTKRYELDVDQEDFAFANSLVIDEKTSTYYGLVFPNYKYHASLQLIVGSLDQPSFYLSGNRIPYLFQDTKSFADLYYCIDSKRFVAVTLFHEENGQATANIYSLYAPPLRYISDYENKQLPIVQYLKYAIFGLLFLLIGIIVYRKSYRRKKRWSEVTHHNGMATLSEVGRNNVLVGDLYIPTDSTREWKNAVFLFGNMQLFDAEGNDITRHFTPLIKELFLVLLLYTLRKESGISSEKLFELLWFGKTVENARNNRSVSIARLKGILDKIGHCRISKDTGYWKLEIDHQQVFLDYRRYLSIVNDKNKLDKQRIVDLSRLVQRGSFLAEVEYEWLDPFKSEISNTIIDTYLHFANSIAISSDPEFLVEVTNYIFNFDPVNEDAMVIKCKALAYLGKHSLATQTFDNFCKEYKRIYGEEFSKDFREVMI